jgi:hypothetical protein
MNTSPTWTTEDYEAALDRLAAQRAELLALLISDGLTPEKAALAIELMQKFLRSRAMH